MNDKQLPRVLILASAGVILFASMFSWMESWNHQEPSGTDANGRPEPAPLTAVQTAPVVQPAAPLGQTSPLAVEPAVPVAEQPFPASRREDVVAQARASAIRRADPMQPVFTASAQPARQDQTVNRQVHRGIAANNIGIVPPPPKEWSFGMVSQAGGIIADPPVPEKQADIPLSDQIRLVGLIDNKAIFTVPKSVAAELNLAHPSFTLAKGERIGSVVVESVTRSSATVRDGRRVSVKELQPIR